MLISDSSPVSIFSSEESGNEKRRRLIRYLKGALLLIID